MRKQKRRSDIRLVNNERDCKRVIEKPVCAALRCSLPLAAIDLRKVEAKIEKPFYVGFSVLELSKLNMYQFHYRYIKKEFGDAAQLLFTDTGTLMYLITGRNPYEKFFADRAEYFDFASFPREHKYFNGANNKVIGMFKDEANGAQITEFVGIWPKMYSFLSNNPTAPEKHVAKGIQGAVAKKLKHQVYLEQLNNPTENRQINRRIGAKLHKIYSIQTNNEAYVHSMIKESFSMMGFQHWLMDIIGQQETWLKWALLKTKGLKTSRAPWKLVL